MASAYRAHTEGADTEGADTMGANTEGARHQEGRHCGGRHLGGHPEACGQAYTKTQKDQVQRETLPQKNKSEMTEEDN